MPELPEVETVKNTLKKQILLRKIVGCDVFYPSMIETGAEQLKKEIVSK